MHVGEKPWLSIHLFKYFNLRTVGWMKFYTEGLSEKSDGFNFCTVQLHRSVVRSEYPTAKTRIWQAYILLHIASFWLCSSQRGVKCVQEIVI